MEGEVTKRRYNETRIAGYALASGAHSDNCSRERKSQISLLEAKLDEKAPEESTLTSTIVDKMEGEMLGHTESARLTSPSTQHLNVAARARLDERTHLG